MILAVFTLFFLLYVLFSFFEGYDVFCEFHFRGKCQIREIILYNITNVKPTIRRNIYGKNCRKMPKNIYFRKRMYVLRLNLGNKVVSNNLFYLK